MENTARGLPPESMHFLPGEITLLFSILKHKVFIHIFLFKRLCYYQTFSPPAVEEHVSHDFLFPLFSGVYFQGTTIGMAPIMSMCTAEQSGGIVMVSDICQSFLMTRRFIDIFEHFKFIFIFIQLFALF